MIFVGKYFKKVFSGLFFLRYQNFRKMAKVLTKYLIFWSIIQKIKAY
jgi:hypothetical protein